MKRILYFGAISAFFFSGNPIIAAIGDSPALDFQTLALTGDLVAGDPNQSRYDRVNAPTINASGEVTFQVELLLGSGIVPVDPTNQLAIVGPTSDGLGLIVREGDSAPGFSGTTVFDTPGFKPRLDAAGDTYFRSSLRSSDGSSILSRNQGLFRYDQSTLLPLLREGDPAPDVADGSVFAGFNSNGNFPFNLNADGGYAVQAMLRNANGSAIGFGDDAFFASGPDGLGLIAREGGLAPGMVNGERLESLAFMHRNDQGQVTFRGSLIEDPSTGVARTTRGVIFGPTANGLGVVVRESDAAPGAIGIAPRFLNFSVPVINNAGQIGFQATLRNSVPDENAQVAYRTTDTGLQLIAQTGTPVPGASDGATYSDLRNFVMNQNGDIAMAIDMAGTGGFRGLIGPTRSGLSLIARQNEAVPGLENTFFGDNFFSYALNGAGDVMFLAFLRENGRDGIRAVFIHHYETDTLYLLAREGGTFDVSDDPANPDLRVVTRVDIEFNAGSGGEDGLPLSFNDAGQVAIGLGFEDGSEGVFLATVPEPSSLTVLGLLGLSVMRRRNQAASHAPQRKTMRRS